MRKLTILAGVAALALAGPALAQGKNGGGSGPKDRGGPAKVERGGGAKTERGGAPQRAERQQGRGSEQREVRAERRPDRMPAASERRDSRATRSEERRERQVREVRQQRGGDRSAEVRQVRVEQDRLVRNGTAFKSSGLIDGCPPGLAAKNNGCLPPGQARKMVGVAAPAALGTALLPPLFRSWFPDNEEYLYRTENGYIYRIDRDRNLVTGFFPLDDDWSGAYAVGATYPEEYLGFPNVPVQYQPWYADGDDYFRYGDGAIYRVDRQGGLIEAIVSLLAGDLAVGQPLPSGYDVYNVPLDYRDRYVDSSDAWYRYNDGYIYRVDPTTRLVQAIVETLV